MDLEVVGRHALLFDDDSMAAFVNSRDALVEWNSLSIDRYDVRHLLSAPPPPRRRRNQLSPLSHAESSLESELDQERYLDLPPDEEDPGVENGAESANLGGFHAIAFSYGNTDESSDQKAVDSDYLFRPSFQVPEGLLQNLPPTEKVHQIMARTALFVSKNGGQSEIVLRVKQGNNPAFGFLMPEHHLHPYFRFLVDHQELLSSDTDGKSSEADKRGDSEVGHRGGALSLLGSVYGTGEDEDDAPEAPQESKKIKSEETSVHNNVPVSLASEGRASSVAVNEKDESVPKQAAPPFKEKGPLIKRNRPISTVKVGAEDGMKKDDEVASLGEKKSGTFSGPSRAEPIIVPPSELKPVVEKIVEFILRNGRQFETILIEQDRNYGRFPFLLPSNQYHPYYLKVLQSDQELKLPGATNESPGHGVEKKSRKSKESESSSLGSDMADELNKKEKFKMVIPNKKKDGADQPPRESQPEMAFGVDAAAAAAILQAVRRGIKHPNIEILPKASGSDSSQPQSREQGVSFKAIAETAAMAAAGEADSSEARLTREQKLKAERLKRAKMFAAMLKVGAVPTKTPTGSMVSGSGAEVAEREREGSSVPPDIDAIARRSKRSYRSRKDDDDGENKEEEEEEEEDGEQSMKKRRHRSSHHSKERHKDRKRHSSSKEERSRHSRHHRRHKHKHDSSSDDDDYHRRKHRRDSYEDEEDGNVQSERSRRRRRGHSRRSRSRSRSQSQSRTEKEIVRQVSQPRPLETSTDEVPDELRAKIRAMLMATM